LCYTINLHISINLMHVTTYHDEGTAKAFGLRTAFAATLIGGDISGASSGECAYQAKQTSSGYNGCGQMCHPTLKIPPPHVYVTQALPSIRLHRLSVRTAQTHRPCVAQYSTWDLLRIRFALFLVLTLLPVSLPLESFKLVLRTQSTAMNLFAVYWPYQQYISGKHRSCLSGGHELYHLILVRIIQYEIPLNVTNSDWFLHMLLWVPPLSQNTHGTKFRFSERFIVIYTRNLHT
jgi:hypothetical protein